MDGWVMENLAGGVAAGALTPTLSREGREREKVVGRGVLGDPAVLAGRREMAAGMDRLRGFAAGVRAAHGPTPDFDPADGGEAARMLLLLETPGPAIWRTGFVSMDNPTGTSANLRRFLAEAGVPRSQIAIWNTVPWVIHTGGPNRAPRMAEIRAGLAVLPGLLPLLPELRCVVLAGRIAAMAGPVIEAVRRDLVRIAVPHPSPTYVCTSPDISHRIVAGLAQAAGLISPPRPRRRPGAGSRTADGATSGGTATASPCGPGHG